MQRLYGESYDENLPARIMFKENMRQINLNKRERKSQRIAKENMHQESKKVVEVKDVVEDDHNSEEEVKYEESTEVR